MFSQLCGILEQRGKSRFPRAGKRQGGCLVDARMALHVRPGDLGDLCELRGVQGWFLTLFRNSGAFLKWKHFWLQFQKDGFLCWILTLLTGKHKQFYIILLSLTYQGTIYKDFFILRTTFYFQHDSHIWGSGKVIQKKVHSVQSVQLAMFGRKDNINQRPEQVH